jgi:hypothetical protein
MEHGNIALFLDIVVVGEVLKQGSGVLVFGIKSFEFVN